MTATLVNSGFKEERWGQMMTLSVFFHLAVFSTILFIPQTTIRYPSIEGRVYHVELVGSPSGLKSGVKGGGRAGIAKTSETSHILTAKTRRIALKKKAVPILAKRVSPIPKATSREKAHSPSELIDKAISPKATSREKAHSPSELIDKAISKIERKFEDEREVQPEKTRDKPEGGTKALPKDEKSGMSSDKGGDSKAALKGGNKGLMSGISSDVGTTLKLYQMEIEDTIKSNWSYPVALLNLKGGKIPEAVVIVTVKRNGRILKTWFKMRSNDRLFDDSVLKAIEKSDPLPGFPQGYRKRYDEVEINFSLKDLV